MSDQRDEVIYDPDRLLSDVLEGQVHTHPLILNESCEPQAAEVDWLYILTSH